MILAGFAVKMAGPHVRCLSDPFMVTECRLGYGWPSGRPNLALTLGWRLFGLSKRLDGEGRVFEADVFSCCIIRLVQLPRVEI